MVLKSSKQLPCDMVIAGVGAKPTGDMYKGQLDFIEERPGGIKVCGASDTNAGQLQRSGRMSGRSECRWKRHAQTCSGS